ncbi:uncharacterized protein [Lepeophtheirus salmonis]|uniref:uncharacterized protein n=1 Tax=Lepeophtheirus salmonis TaxID=72036 RepID=UPI003AF370E4
MTSCLSSPLNNAKLLKLDVGGGGHNPEEEHSKRKNHLHDLKNSSGLPSFSDLLWCPDVDNEIMTNPNLQMNSQSGTGSDDPLADLNELELAALVGSPCNPTPVKNPQLNPHDSNIPADISDLRSADLLQTIPGSIDIDKIFADFQAESNNNNNNNNNIKALLQQPRKVIITRKSSSMSDLVSAVAHRATNYLSNSSEENNNNIVSYKEKLCSDKSSSSYGEPVFKARRFLSSPPPRYTNLNDSGQQPTARKIIAKTTTVSPPSIKQEIPDSSSPPPSKCHRSSPKIINKPVLLHPADDRSRMKGDERGDHSFHAPSNPPIIPNHKIKSEVIEENHEHEKKEGDRKGGYQGDLPTLDDECVENVIQSLEGGGDGRSVRTSENNKPPRWDFVGSDPHDRIPTSYGALPLLAARGHSNNSRYGTNHPTGSLPPSPADSGVSDVDPSSASSHNSDDENRIHRLNGPRSTAHAIAAAAAAAGRLPDVSSHPSAAVAAAAAAAAHHHVAAGLFSHFYPNTPPTSNSNNNNSLGSSSSNNNSSNGSHDSSDNRLSGGHQHNNSVLSSVASPPPSHGVGQHNLSSSSSSSSSLSNNNNNGGPTAVAGNTPHQLVHSNHFPRSAVSDHLQSMFNYTTSPSPSSYDSHHHVPLGGPTSNYFVHGHVSPSNSSEAEELGYGPPPPHLPHHITPITLFIILTTGTLPMMEEEPFHPLPRHLHPPLLSQIKEKSTEAQNWTRRYSTQKKVQRRHNHVSLGVSAQTPTRQRLLSTLHQMDQSGEGGI